MWKLDKNTARKLNTQEQRESRHRWKRSVLLQKASSRAIKVGKMGCVM